MKIRFSKCSVKQRKSGFGVRLTAHGKIRMPRSQSGTADDDDCSRLLEDGFFRILENGDFRLMEDCAGPTPPG